MVTGFTIKLIFETELKKAPNPVPERSKEVLSWTFEEWMHDCIFCVILVCICEDHMMGRSSVQAVPVKYFRI